MPIYLKQSTASQEIPLGPFVDSTDGNTEETALSIANTDIKLWIAGAPTLASKTSGGATYISNGVYYCVLDATDTATLGSLVVFVHVSGALAVRVECVVLAANVYDSLVGGGDILDVSVTQFGGTNGTFASGRAEVNLSHIAGSAVSTTTAQLGVNAVQLSGDATAADNAEAFFDGTGYAGTNNVIPTVTTLTNLPAITANWLTATGINAGAITSAKFAAGAIDAAAIAADAIGASELAADAVTEIVTGVWEAATATYGGAGSYGALIETNLDAAVSSRMATYTQPSGFLAATFPGGTIANTTNITAGTITTATNLTTNNDKTGYSILAGDKDTLVDLVWDEVLTGATHNVNNSSGKRLRQIQSGSSAFSGTIDGTPTSTTIPLDSGASATTDFYKPGLVVIESSFGVQFRRIDSYDGGTKTLTVATAFTTTPDDTDVVTIVPWASVRVSDIDSGVITAASVAAAALNGKGDWNIGKTGYSILAGDKDTLVDLIWDEATSGHTTAGTTGKALTDAGGAGDPWSTVLPGAYGAGTAGKIVGDNINATVSSRATQTSVDTIDGIVDDILVDTAVIGALGAGLTAIPWNASWDAEVQSEVADALAVYDPPTNAEMEARTIAAANYATASALDTVDTVADAIKAKTDSLTFTQAGHVDANIQRVNDVTVNGTGAVGDEWGP